MPLIPSSCSSFDRVTNTGTMQSSGNTGTTTNYEFTDRYAFVSGQSYFYRIKQVDIDGRSSYSPILPVRYDANRTEWRVYPNPVGKNRQINLVATGMIRFGEMIQVQLINAMGQVIYQSKDIVANVTGNINRQFQKLSPGFYTISIQQQSGNHLIKVIVPDVY